ncbi:putative transcriptional regulator [Scopulibacillus daqui]|uniref:Transcriptional regulator n=1 Tax=Scopulibacillus daqui TaxID=1469162 RepID=A0ABS2PX39_9BACL|nr:YkyA family protein [Scopulibacillus daqui]MBM7643867.1 putative transcriptional regulator [Scopulibacillus daqui]
MFVLIKRYIAPVSFIALGIFVLSGCGFADKDVKKIYGYLEKSANIEQNLNDMQKVLINNQKKENNIYNKILNLKLGDGNQIESLSNQADKLNDKCEEILKEEKKMIDRSYEYYKKAEPLLNHLDKDDLKAKADNVSKTASRRYEMFGRLYRAYIDNINLNKNLYTLLHEKNLDQSAYKNQIDEINKKSEEISKLRDTFNHYTTAYNEAKIQLYNAGHLNVKYDDQ